MVTTSSQRDNVFLVQRAEKFFNIRVGTFDVIDPFEWYVTGVTNSTMLVGVYTCDRVDRAHHSRCTPDLSRAVSSPRSVSDRTIVGNTDHCDVTGRSVLDEWRPHESCDLHEAGCGHRIHSAGVLVTQRISSVVEPRWWSRSDEFTSFPPSAKPHRTLKTPITLGRLTIFPQDPKATSPSTNSQDDFGRRISTQ